jgi:hypothetical protein
MWEIMPNPGKIRMYTSGCPKNQNRCWYRIGSPPPAGSKNEVFRLRSVSNIVIAPAKTGKDNKSNTAVIRTLHTNNGIRSMVIPAGRILMQVVIKLIAPKIEEAPARCNEKIVRSTLGPAWAMFAERGGYTVHPVPAPLSAIIPTVSRSSEGGSNQNLILFIRGKAMSGAPSIKGTSQFPNPPIIIGITIKKIMMNAWAVTIVL